MDFIKKHYEKILLSVVLLGLVGALVFMAFDIPIEQGKVRDIGEGLIRTRPTPLPPLDLTQESNVLEQTKSPYKLDFQSTNRLFNPVEWVRMPNGHVQRADIMTPDKAVVTRITPLYTIVSLDSIETNELGARYVVGVEHQAAASPYLRRKQTRYVSTDDSKKDVFTLIKVVGAPENPDYLDLRLADSGEEIQLSKGKPFRRVDGYTADVKYEPENDIWTGKRVGDHLKFDRDDFTIVDIDSNEVVLWAQSNQKKWTLRYSP